MSQKKMKKIYFLTLDAPLANARFIASRRESRVLQQLYAPQLFRACACDFLTDSGPKCYILTDWIWLHHRARRGKSYVEQKTHITCSLTSLISALYMQRCEKLTNHMEGVHINKGPLSEISIFIYCRGQRWSSSSEENICEELVSNLFKVSVEIVY